MDDLVDPDSAVFSGRKQPWQDPHFDGRLVVADRSTDVYCRPGCSLPRPRARDTRYFLIAAAAAEAGFRPCLECRPEAAPAPPAWTDTPERVIRALELIQDGMLDRRPVCTLATRLGIGERHLRRLLIQHVGASPVGLAQTRRLQLAKRLLDETDLPMSEVALAAGYGSVRRFNAAFRRDYRLTPSEIRRRRPVRPPTPRDTVVLRLAYHAPLDWRDLLAAIHTRAIAGVERVHGETYTRCVDAGNRAAVVTVQPAATAGALEVGIRGAPAAAIADVVNRVQRMFDLSLDPGQVRRAFRNDRLLAPLVARAPGLRFAGDWSLFEAAVRVLLGGGDPERERILVARLLRACGVPAPPATPDGPAPTRPFPRPDRVLAANLAAAGLSDAAVRNLRTIATGLVAGSLDSTVSTKELVRQLLALPGLGVASAQLIAARGLGERDAYPLALPGPAGGTGPRNGLAPISTATAWRPWRSYACLYLARAADPARRGVAVPGS